MRLNSPSRSQELHSRLLEKPSSLHASDDSSAPNADSWKEEGRIRVSQWRQDFSFGLDFYIKEGEDIKKILIGLLGNEWKEMCKQFLQEILQSLSIQNIHLGF